MVLVHIYPRRVWEVEAGGRDNHSRSSASLRPAWAAGAVSKRVDKQKELLDFCPWGPLVLKEHRVERMLEDGRTGRWPRWVWGPLSSLSPGHGRKWSISLPSPNPKISLFRFVKCKKGIWERVVVRPLPTPQISLSPTVFSSIWEEADPEKWVVFLPC